MAIGTLNREYVSSLDYMDTRELLREILDTSNEKMSFIDVMELTNRMVQTDQTTYRHFVNEDLFTLGVVSAVSGTGTTINVTITAASKDSCKAKDTVIFPDGKQGYVQSKSAATNPVLVVISLDGTAITNSCSAGDNLSFYANAHGEGTGSPDPEEWPTTAYSNQVQIYKAKYAVTDLQKTSRIEATIGGKDFYFYKVQDDVLTKFKANIGFSMLLSIASAANFGSSAATITDSDGKAIQTTRGLNQYIEDYGINNTMDGTTIALSDFEDLNRTMTLARCPDSYEVYTGVEFAMPWDNFFNGLQNNGIISQAGRYQINQNMEFGVTSVRLYGRDYHRIDMPQLDHRGVTHYTGAPDEYKSAYFIPRDKVMVQGGGRVDRLRVRYMQNDGTDLRYKEYVTGGLAPRPTNDIAELAFSYESVMGLEVLGAVAFAKMTPAATT